MPALIKTSTQVVYNKLSQSFEFLRNQIKQVIREVIAKVVVQSDINLYQRNGVLEIQK